MSGSSQQKGVVDPASMGRGFLRNDAKSDVETVGKQTGVITDKVVTRQIQTSINNETATKARQNETNITELFKHVYTGNLDSVRKFIMTSSNTEVSDALLRKHPLFKHTVLERSHKEALMHKGLKGVENRNEIYALFFVAHTYGPKEARTRIAAGVKTLPAVVALELKKELTVVAEDLSITEKLFGAVMELAKGFVQNPAKATSNTAMVLTRRTKDVSAKILALLFPPSREWNGYQYMRVDPTTRMDKLASLLDLVMGRGKSKRRKGHPF